MKRIIFLTFLIVLATSCGKDQSTLKFSVPTPAAKPQIEAIKVSEDRLYDLVQEKLFVKSCTKCHNAKSHAEKKRIDLTNKEAIIRDYELVIYSMTEAFNTKDKPMPPRGGPVDPRLLQVFKAWKENGFKEAP